MKQFFALLLVFGSISNTLIAQIYDPVSWSTSYKQISDSEFDLIYTATIQDGWTIYSQYLESEDGPVATTINYDEGAHFKTVGKNVESDKNKKEGFDKLFDMNVIKYSKKATFTQRVKVANVTTPITGYVNFMTCDATKCLPPSDFDFTFNLKPKKVVKEGEKKVEKVVTNTKEKIKDVASNVATTTKETANQAGKAIKEAANKAKDKISTTVKKAEEKVEEVISDTEEDAENEAAESGILDPVKWSGKMKSLGNDMHELIFQADLDKGWTLYSQFTDDNGPIPTSFEFDKADHFELVGKAEEAGKKKEGPDPLFGDVNVVKFVKGPVTFTQKIKITKPAQAVTGYLTYMTCDNKRCLPPTEVDYFINANAGTFLVGEAATVAIDNIRGDSENVATGNTTVLPAVGPYPGEMAKVDLNNPVHQCGETVEKIEASQSYWRIFVLGFLGGLVALLTPCVFPMIPLTVSFFTKGSENKKKGLTNAFLYGFFILAVYLILSIPFHLMDTLNPDILNDISTNVWLNIAFFVIFIFFAFSFFGYYEITLPQSWTNKSASAEGAGGLLGIFFMALTLALVSFSCTGPILGSLLAGALSSDGGAWQLTAGMGGFGFALALPFALFAAFPSWLNNLPQSGGWLTTVKVVLGFLEVALAFKFLSNADLVKHWGLLKIEPFLIIWILTFLGLGIYLFGKIRFPHDSPNPQIGLTRKILGALSIGFAIYLMSGFRYDAEKESFTPLTLLSGLAPPVGYSWIYPKECPNNLNCFKDFDKGLAYAQKQNKPILVDFTGYACVNCRKMEEHVWPRPNIKPYLEDDYVLISLYVDEKVELPKEEQITVTKKTGGTRKLRTKGHKWAHFQTEFFDTNAQPYYALLAPDGTLLNRPVGYTPDEAEYQNFLECGLTAFDEVNQTSMK